MSTAWARLPLVLRGQGFSRALIEAAVWNNATIQIPDLEIQAPPITEVQG